MTTEPTQTEAVMTPDTDKLIEWLKMKDRLARADTQFGVMPANEYRWAERTAHALLAELDRLRTERDKFMWQVRDTCTRAEKAEAELAQVKADATKFSGEIDYIASNLQVLCDKQAMELTQTQAKAEHTPDPRMAELEAENKRLREALRRIQVFSPAVRHGWATGVREMARQALKGPN